MVCPEPKVVILGNPETGTLESLGFQAWSSRTLHPTPLSGPEPRHPAPGDGHAKTEGDGLSGRGQERNAKELFDVGPVVFLNTLA